MKLWAGRHRQLSSARTQVACRLHAVLCELVAGGVPDQIYPSKAAQLLGSVDPQSAVEAARVELAEELLEDLRRVDHQIAESKKRLAPVATVVLLHASRDETMNRVVSRGDGQHLATFGSLYDSEDWTRLGVDVVIETDDLSVDEVAGAIAAAVGI